MLSHAIVLTVYNAPFDVNLCLQSLALSLDFEKTELVLVDDASEQETACILDMFVQKYPRTKLVRHTENKGYLHSVNDGVKACSSDIVTLLNSDTYIPTDFSPRIFACFESDAKIGVASPVLASGNPFSVPLLENKLKKVPSERLADLVAEKNRQAEKILPLYSDIVFPDGACFSVRRECFEAVGLFSEAYSPGYFEELDFCMRAVQKGFRTVLIDNLYVYHKSHASFGKKQTSEYMRRNRKLFAETWGGAYRALAERHPKKEHKKRVYRAFYPLGRYYFAECMLRLSKIVPYAPLRRKIRAMYQ